MAMSLSLSPLRCRLSISSPMARASSSPSQWQRTMMRLAVIPVGAERLAESAFILGDKAGSGAQNMRRRAIVALQPDDLGAGEILLEAQDVVHLGAAPAIDRLIVVAHAADIPWPWASSLQPEILRHIGVLIFVDQHVFEAVLIVFQNIGMVLEDAQDFEQQIAEIGGIQDFRRCLVFGIRA